MAATEAKLEHRQGPLLGEQDTVLSVTPPKLTLKGSSHSSSLTTSRLRTLRCTGKSKHSLAISILDLSRTSLFVPLLC